MKEIIEKQEIHQVFKRIVKPKNFNSVVSNYPMDCVQCDFIVYDRYKQNHYSYILTIIFDKEELCDFFKAIGSLVFILVDVSDSYNSFENSRIG